MIEIIPQSPPPPLQLKVKRLRPGAQLPQRRTEGAAGWDLAIPEGEHIAVVLRPHYALCIPLGIAIEAPKGYEAQIRIRSSSALRGYYLANAIGTIDSDYRGELILLMCSRTGEFDIYPGERLAQLVLQRVPEAELIEVAELSETKRGTGGLGSTGR